MIQIDMEMPDCCGNCPCFHFENPMYCRAKTDVHQRVTAPNRSPRPDWCPLHEANSENTGEWISVQDGMPTEHDSIFAKDYGTKQWNPNMFQRISDDVRVAVRFEDGTRMVSHDHTFDGKWRCEAEKTAYPKRTVTHWMPNPELPEEEA